MPPPKRRRPRGGVRIEPKLLIPEAQFQQTINQTLDQFGYLWFHDYDSTKNNAALTDIVAVHPITGTLLFWEAKTDSGRLSKPTIVTHRRDPKTGQPKALRRPILRRGQTEWRDALKISMRRAAGVVDYRVVRPSTWHLALAFLVSEHERAGGTPIRMGRLL